MQRGTEARVFGQPKERRFKISLGRYTRLPGHKLSWPVSMKFKTLSDQRATSVFALIVKQP